MAKAAGWENYPDAVTMGGGDGTRHLNPLWGQLPEVIRRIELVGDSAPWPYPDQANDDIRVEYCYDTTWDGEPFSTQVGLGTLASGSTPPAVGDVIEVNGYQVAVTRVVEDPGELFDGDRPTGRWVMWWHITIAPVGGER